MTKVIHLKNELTDTHQSMLALLKNISERVESGQIDQLCIVARQPNSENESVVIGWSGVNPCDMQYLVSNLQCDVIFDCMRRAGM